MEIHKEEKNHLGLMKHHNSFQRGKELLSLFSTGSRHGSTIDDALMLAGVKDVGAEIDDGKMEGHVKTSPCLLEIFPLFSESMSMHFEELAI